MDAAANIAIERASKVISTKYCCILCCAAFRVRLLAPLLPFWERTFRWSGREGWEFKAFVSTKPKQQVLYNYSNNHNNIHSSSNKGNAKVHWRENWRTQRSLFIVLELPKWSRECSRGWNYNKICSTSGFIGLINENGCDRNVKHLVCMVF